MNEAADNLSEARLVELLERQNELYRRLRGLAERQKALVAQDDARPLLELLAERQKVVDGLIALNGALAAYRRNWTERYHRLEEPTRRQVAALLEEANASLGAVLQSDQRDSATLSAKREDLAGRLAVADTGSRASAAYATAGAGAPGSITDAQALPCRRRQNGRHRRDAGATVSGLRPRRASGSWRRFCRPTTRRRSSSSRRTND
jgi:hypothetical protein